MSTQAQAQALYLKMQVNTASPGDLTLMLYNGCIKFMKQGLDALKRKDFEAKNDNIKRAQDIIDELVITLNMKYDIAKQLSALYEFINWQLVEANVKLHEQSLETAIDMVTELRDAWAEANKIVKNQAKVSL
jgi:flagellar secretion chaperone FliS